MKRITLFAYIIFIILVCSCKKNHDNQDIVNSPFSLIKSMMYTDTTGHDTIASMSFQYDSSGRIEQWISETSPGSGLFIHKYKYYPSKVIDQISFSNNENWGKIIFYINSEGYATSEVEITYGTSTDSSIIRTETFKYNTDGYMTEKMIYLSGDTAKWTSWKWQIMNSNIITLELDHYDRTGGSETESYEYYPNSINTFGNSNMGMMYFGKSNTNLIKSTVTNSITPKNATYFYSFDPMNRVIKESIRGNGLTSGSLNLMITYY